MEYNKSLDEVEIIAALLHDIHNVHGLVFNIRALRLTQTKVRNRTRSEGLGFLTKTLPRLGKAFDKALTGCTTLNATKLGFDAQNGSELPRFLGEFFNKVFHPNGAILQDPCATSVKVIRQVLYLFYKYELPYTDEQEQQVIDAFKRAESDLSTISPALQAIEAAVGTSYTSPQTPASDSKGTVWKVARGAKDLLARLFCTFDPLDIYPRHGPGSVATKQRLHEKFLWTNVSSQLTDVYPLDAYFFASSGHVCDAFRSFVDLTDVSHSARVILVPKDSRGPRLISCEPVDFQWIQQGLSRSIVSLVESHKLTKFNVNFTNQQPNQFAALLGSRTGKYVTLDLKEASDRISVDLVRMLFPSHVYTYLEACRTSSTVLPDGQVLKLNKFAPMGSALCFPILALCVWSILTSAAPDADTRESILVYGDDVIVPKGFALNAIEQLESFGLLVNRDKSCTSGFFRESCGTDAFQGVNVTPVRFRTVWSSTPAANVYSSWIAYANSMYDRQYHRTYDYIVSGLLSVYKRIPSDDMELPCPSLRFVPAEGRPTRRRFHKGLQKLQWKVNDIKSPTITHEIDGWAMLLRYFTEGSRHVMNSESRKPGRFWDVRIDDIPPFAVRQYTSRDTSILVSRWR